jgi:GNAT superfamily N-acetyltransferase
LTLQSGLQLEWLTSQTLDRFRPFLPAGLDGQVHLQGKPRFWQAPGCYGLAVSLLGLPLGLLLVQIRGPFWGRNAEVISLMVAERFRRRGLATWLLDTAQKALAKAGCRELRLSYPKMEEIEPAMLRLCADERGWQAAGGTLLYSCNVGDVPAFLASLSSYNDRLLAAWPLACIAYGDLTEQQLRRSLRRLKPPGWAHPPLPKTTEEGWGQLDPQLSKGLLLGDELVGWCLCHRISGTAHRITVAYVGEAYQSKGWMVVPLLKTVAAVEAWNASTDRNPDHGIRFGIRDENIAMLRFAERRIKPFAIKATLTVERVKRLR